MDKYEKNFMKFLSFDLYYLKDMLFGIRVEKIFILILFYVEIIYFRVLGV